MPELDEEGRWTASEASLFLGFHETRGRAAMIEKHWRDENERQCFSVSYTHLTLPTKA